MQNSLENGTVVREQVHKNDSITLFKSKQIDKTQTTYQATVQATISTWRDFTLSKNISSFAIHSVPFDDSSEITETIIIIICLLRVRTLRLF